MDSTNKALDFLALSFDNSLNPSETDLENNAKVNAMIENYLIEWDDTSIEDVLDAVEEQGLSIDRYINDCIASMEFSQQANGLFVPCHLG